MEVMDFGEALAALKQGKRVSRRGWIGPDQWIKLQRPDGQSKMGLPYIFIRTVTNHFVPWVASHVDMLSADWFELAD